MQTQNCYEGTSRMKNLRNTCYMNAPFQCLVAKASSLRRSSLNSFLGGKREICKCKCWHGKVIHNTERKVMHPAQTRHVIKVELSQFADNTQQEAHRF